MPHELVYKVLGECSKLEEMEVEAQWRDLVADVRESGALGQCLAVADVSGSMSGTPMNVAIALSLLVSEVAEGPWQGKICTFSKDPKFVTIPSGPTTTLSSRARATEDLDWGMNTDFLHLGLMQKHANLKARVKPQAVLFAVCFCSILTLEWLGTWYREYEATAFCCL